VTVLPLAADSATVKVMSVVTLGSLPSVTAAALPTDTVGAASSSVTVTSTGSAVTAL